MYDHVRWHAEGLRWIGSLFNDFAERLERVSIAATPCEPVPADRRRDEDDIDEVRRRVYSRYF